MVIDDVERETFAVQGGVAVRGLIDPHWIESLRESMDAILEHTYESYTKMPSLDRTVKSPVVQSDGMWRYCEPFTRFLFESPLAATAASLLRATAVRLYEDLMLYRDAGVGNGAPGWHRDSPYWPVKGDQMVNAWFSLESVTATTGAIRIVEGSHLDPDDVVRSSVSSKDEPDPERVVVFEAEPGDVILFHPRTLHSGYGSAPDRPRRTFTIRFMGDDVRFRKRGAYFHQWMSECGLETGDALDHPGFPQCWPLVPA